MSKFFICFWCQPATLRTIYPSSFLFDLLFPSVHFRSEQSSSGRVVFLAARFLFNSSNVYFHVSFVFYYFTPGWCPCTVLDFAIVACILRFPSKGPFIFGYSLLYMLSKDDALIYIHA